ncbi:hypothetical protein F4777DRAFT_577875 [Nemania sp. FL0916]|nr:hypothetical protein F4777DRAFT_577875 [Nemania sp. FL0916]
MALAHISEISTALRAYEAERLPRSTKMFWVRWAQTRFHADDGWPMYIFQRWVLPVLGLDFMGAQVAKACCDAPQLNYVAYQQRKGFLPWSQTKISSGPGAGLVAKALVPKSVRDRKGGYDVKGIWDTGVQRKNIIAEF